ncbi:hypothetical protein BDW02DRAFT_183830 [Decorospora gaudefroyi]|uniref:Uncharacterized protein n=1 Tax=Decorospora gaudefroyi TaxID=184978 RepID=A0A6A5K3B9_9PLEO|nr:hypothetical protein BDW02DRAFT_183830 [Decorospora gaudefroyi]
MDPRVEYVSVPDLYTRFSTYVLTSIDPKDKSWWKWLSLAFTIGKPEGLPSWVPDLHEHRNLRETHILHQSASYWASTKKDFVPLRGPKLGQLVLRGKTVDEVAISYPEVIHNSSYWPYGSESDPLTYKWVGFLIRVAEWEEKLARDVLEGDSTDNQMRSFTDTGPRISLDTYWRTLIGNQVTLLEGHLVTCDSYDDFQTMCRRVREVAKTHDIRENPVTNPRPTHRRKIFPKQSSKCFQERTKKKARACCISLRWMLFKKDNCLQRKKDDSGSHRQAFSQARRSGF